MDSFIDAYKIDSGERDTIRLATIRLDVQVVFDDAVAFVTATHFGLRPIILLDLLVEWVKTGLLDKDTTLRIVAAVATRYSEAFVNHSKYKILGAGK